MDWLSKTLNKILGRDNGGQMMLSELSEVTGFNYNTLKRAAQDGRLNAVKVGGHFWLATVSDVEKAVAEGKMKPLQGEE